MKYYIQFKNHKNLQLSEMFPGTVQTSKMEGFPIIVNNLKPLTIFWKLFILDVYEGHG